VGLAELFKVEREEQILLRREDQVGRYRCQLAEEIIARSGFRPRGAPELVADVADSMHGEGQQVEAHHERGQVLLAVPEAVLKVH